ncbi:MAG TPA: SDR family oxidoreductase [Glaciihabitans sp.]|jgi:NAD(P)-dependent dehydrogenase (short-subunit alcohol dehydrogenase family)|nr:SDR family oxidoreductase [Glaciihabitans sp.]
MAVIETENPRRVVVVGASSPAGLATCTSLRAAGMRVVAVGSNSNRLADVSADNHYVCDVSDATAVTALAEQIRREVGAPDGLIHLVGGWRAGQDDESWEFLNRQLITTLRNTSRAFHADLSASPAGRLAIISSTSVDRPTWSNANYATAKAAAETWVAAIASGWKKAGTAAAVTLVVRAIGTADGYTTPETIAERITLLWTTPAVDINGKRIPLTPGHPLAP